MCVRVLNMFTLNRILIISSAFMALSSTASAFFLNWGSQETSPATYPQYYYHQRLLQAPTTYTVSGTEPPQPVPVPVPSIPIQVPLQAQLTPTATVHNVQLVPCLCPVSQDYEFEKGPQEGVYFANNQQHKIN